MPEAEYIIARLYPGRFSVAKFTGGDVPEAVYLVNIDSKRGDSCTCPGFRGHKHCHHIKDVKQAAAHLLTLEDL